MSLHVYLVALLLALIASVYALDLSTISVEVTTLITITACNSKVKSCPGQSYGGLASSASLSTHPNSQTPELSTNESKNLTPSSFSPVLPPADRIETSHSGALHYPTGWMSSPHNVPSSNLVYGTNANSVAHGQHKRQEVTATINGQVVSWQNNWLGESSTLSKFGPPATTPSNQWVTATINGEVVSWVKNWFGTPACGSMTLTPQMVTATIDGQVVSWVNNWFSSPAAAPRSIASCAEMVTATINGQTVSWAWQNTKPTLSNLQPVQAGTSPPSALSTLGATTQDSILSVPASSLEGTSNNVALPASSANTRSSSVSLSQTSSQLGLASTVSVSVVSTGNSISGVALTTTSLSSLSAATQSDNEPPSQSATAVPEVRTSTSVSQVSGQDSTPSGTSIYLSTLEATKSAGTQSLAGATLGGTGSGTPLQPGLHSAATSTQWVTATIGGQVVSWVFGAPAPSIGSMVSPTLMAPTTINGQVSSSPNAFTSLLEPQPSGQPSSQTLAVITSTSTGLDTAGHSFTTIVLVTSLPSSQSVGQLGNTSLVVVPHTSTGINFSGNSFTVTALSISTPTASNAPGNSPVTQSSSSYGSLLRGSSFTAPASSSISGSISLGSTLPNPVEPFTTTLTNISGGLVTTTIELDFTPSPNPVKPFTTTLTKTVGGLVTTTLEVDFTPLPNPVETFTTTLTNIVGGLVTTTVKVGFTPLPNPVGTFTTTLTNTVGGVVTTTVEVGFTPSPNPVKPFTTLLTLTFGGITTTATTVEGGFTSSQGQSTQSEPVSSPQSEPLSPLISTGTSNAGTPLPTTALGSTPQNKLSSASLASTAPPVILVSPSVSGGSSATSNPSSLSFTSPSIGTTTQGNIPSNGIPLSSGICYSTSLSNCIYEFTPLTNGEPCPTTPVPLPASCSASFTSPGSMVISGSSAGAPPSSGVPPLQTSGPPNTLSLFPVPSQGNSGVSIPPAPTTTAQTCSPWPLCAAIPTPAPGSSAPPVIPPSPNCSSWPVCFITSTPSPVNWITVAVTSTITTSPPGFSEETTSRSDWTTNTLLTTTDSSGHTTILPVIVGCPGCGGTDYILWNLPDIPNVEWIIPKLPGLPKLPRFHIPCIIGCNKGGGGPPSPPEPPITDPKPDDQMTEEPSSTSSCSTSVATDVTVFVSYGIDVDGSTTASVTSSEFNTITACSASAFTTTTTTSSVATATPTAWLITPNYDVGTAALSAFNDQLKQETDPATLWVGGRPDAEFFTYWYQKLNETQVEEYGKNPAVGSIFPAADSAMWDGSVTEEAAPAGETEPADNGLLLPSITPWTGNRRHLQDSFQNSSHSGSRLKKRLTQKPTTLDDQKLYSQPAGVSLNDIYTYAFEDETLGDPTKRPRIYIVDSGADITSSYYKNMNPEPKWLWPNSNPPYVPPELPFRNTYGLKSDYGPGGINHGSGMLSRAVGPSWGVSQSADVTVVKVAEPIRGTMDPQNQPLTGMRRVNGIDALVEALLDIKSRGLANRAVVSVSWVFLPDALNNPPRPTEQLDYVMYTTVKAMIDYGVIFVGATGNNGDPSAPNYVTKDLISVPSIWRSGPFNIFVVGAVDNGGRVLPSAQFHSTNTFPLSYVDVWAPGDQVPCAGVGEEIFLGTGSSPAVAEVAGLITYFLGVDKHRTRIEAIYQGYLAGGPPTGYIWSQAVKAYVARLAYPRSQNQPFSVSAQQPVGINPNAVGVLWNGEVPLNLNNQPACVLNPALNPRQAAESDCAPHTAIQATNPQGSLGSFPTSVLVSSQISPATQPAITQAPTLTSSSSSGLPKLSKQCYSSEVVNCQFIYNPVSDLASCPTTTMPLPASCTQAPSTSTCYSTTLENCIYQFIPLTNGEPCPTTGVPLPASCAPGFTQPTTTSSPPPEVTCTSILDGNTQIDVSIFTNYITDNGVKLLASINNNCDPHTVAQWKVQDAAVPYTAADGTKWTSTQKFTFILQNPFAAGGIEDCVAYSIRLAGGPANTPGCPWGVASPPPDTNGPPKW